jgi:hypothetical protein
MLSNVAVYNGWTNPVGLEVAKSLVTAEPTISLRSLQVALMTATDNGACPILTFGGHTIAVRSEQSARMQRVFPSQSVGIGGSWPSRWQQSETLLARRAGIPTRTFRPMAILSFGKTGKRPYATLSDPSGQRRYPLTNASPLNLSSTVTALDAAWFGARGAYLNDVIGDVWPRRF